MGDIERKYPCHLLASPLRPRLHAPWRDDRRGRGPGSRPVAGGRLPSAGLCRRRHRVPTWIWSASGERLATGAGQAGGICPHPGPTAPAAAGPRDPARRPPPRYSGAEAALRTRLGRGCDRRCLWAERARSAAGGRGRAPEPSEKARRSASGAVRRGGGSGAARGPGEGRGSRWSGRSRSCGTLCQAVAETITGGGREPALTGGPAPPRPRCRRRRRRTSAAAPPGLGQAPGSLTARFAPLRSVVPLRVPPSVGPATLTASFYNLIFFSFLLFNF